MSLILNPGKRKEKKKKQEKGLETKMNEEIKEENEINDSSYTFQTELKIIKENMDRNYDGALIVMLKDWSDKTEFLKQDGLLDSYLDFLGECFESIGKRKYELRGESANEIPISAYRVIGLNDYCAHFVGESTPNSAVSLLNELRRTYSRNYLESVSSIDDKCTACQDSIDFMKKVIKKYNPYPGEYPL